MKFGSGKTNCVLSSTFSLASNIDYKTPASSNVSRPVVVCEKDFESQGEEMLTREQSDKREHVFSCIMDGEKQSEWIFPKFSDCKEDGRRFVLADLKSFINVALQ